MAHGQTELQSTLIRSRQAALPIILLALLAMAPWRSAHAYIDPNTAGPIYQFLFPFLIAVASALTALRRYIARLWQRLVHAVENVMRGQRTRPESDTDG